MFRYLRFLVLAAASLQKNFDSNRECTTNPADSVTKEKLLETYCTGAAFPAANKPPVRVGILDQNPDKGRVAPVSCFSDENRCQEEVDAWVAHKKNPEIAARYKEMKAEIETKMAIWQKEFNAKLVTVIEHKEVTPQQEEALQQLYEQLHQLKIFYVTAQIMMDYNLGNCGEQAAFSAHHLLENAQKFNLKLRIQIVNLKSSKFPNMHAFLLIDSDAPDIEIKNDGVKTANYLKKLKKSAYPGTICDLYNQGLMTPFGKDSSNLYDEKGQWDSIKVSTLEIDFAKINILPGPFKKIICDELTEIKFEKEPTRTCRPS